MEKQCTHEKCTERSITFPNGCARFPDVRDCGAMVENNKEDVEEGNVISKAVV